jgi:glycosyltransferase involved in cell wall biosynthesis
VCGLSGHHKIRGVTQSLSEFWTGPYNHDVLHIQWPEGLYKWDEIGELDEWELGYLSDKLEEWAAQRIIVTTVHNVLPHDHSGHSARMLYDVVYNYSDGVIHMGDTSRSKFDRRFSHSSGLEHRIIPHGNYSCFPNTMNREEARGDLGLRNEDPVALAFGAIRTFDEAKLLFEGFNAWNQSAKKLIVAGRIPWPEHRNSQWLFLKWNTFNRHVTLHEGWIPDDEVQVYFNAADAVIIPRIESLNSGNVALGFTFGRVVVGPHTGVIGEQLRETSNPTFDPESPQSVADSLNEAMTLVRKNHGDQNRKVARERWDWPSVADQHVSFYRHLAEPHLST